MTDPDWTADEAYRILRTSIERFLASESNAAGLHLWLTDTYGTPPGTPSDHPANRLFQHVLLHVAVYLQCDLDRSVLMESLHQIVNAFDHGELVGLTPLTSSPCFIAMIKAGTAPAPLIALDTEERYRRYWLMREGFTDI